MKSMVSITKQPSLTAFVSDRSLICSLLQNRLFTTITWSYSHLRSKGEPQDCYITNITHWSRTNRSGRANRTPWCTAPLTQPTWLGWTRPLPMLKCWVTTQARMHSAKKWIDKPVA
jgi:hypothetical protein